jgi:hypothetical protein
MTVLLYRPIPVVLLVVGCFYLWAFMTYKFQPDGLLQQDDVINEPVLAVAK